MTVIKDAGRGDFIAAAGLLGLTLLLGGGSAFSPLQRTIVELAGVVVLGWFFVRGWRVPRTRPITVALILIAALVMLMILQTIPLPPGLWRALPGRIAVADVLDVVDGQATWLPLSLDPASTRETLCFLIAPVAMFVATLHLDRDAQARLLLMIVVAAIISAVLVMIQAQGATWLTLYDAPHDTKGKGIFANKNHNAALLITAIPLIAMLGRSLTLLRQPGAQRAMTLILIALLSIAVVGCLSRAGIALLPLALLACIPLLGSRTLIRRHWKIMVCSAAILAAAAVGIAQSSIARETFDRFGASQEGRYIFWPDVIEAIHQFMPWGSGFGTFVPVFRIYESLDAVHQTYTNHAHSDFMEIALEGGIPGLSILTVFLIWFAMVGWARLRDRIGTPDFSMIVSAITGMLLLLAASIVDYPLRTLLLACVFSVLAAILASPAPPARTARRGIARQVP